MKKNPEIGLLNADLEFSRFKGSSRTCSLTKPGREPRESESVAGERDLGALVVNCLESTAREYCA